MVRTSRGRKRSCLVDCIRDTARPGTRRTLTIVAVVGLLILAIAIAIIVVKRRGSGDGSSSPIGRTVPVALTGNLTGQQIDTILSLVSIVENGNTMWWDHYTYCEDIGDGRGYTAGLCGLCSGTGDLLDAFRTLADINPSHPLLRHIPALVAVNGSPSTRGLSSLPGDILANTDAAYAQAQWETCNDLYWAPPMQFAATAGLTWPFTRGQLYDTALNFGNITAITSRVTSRTPADGGEEGAWVREFLDVKRYLITVVDRSLNFGQPDRVDMWKSILENNNTQLRVPMKNLTCYGQKFVVDF